MPVKVTQKGTFDKTLSSIKTKVSDKTVTLSGEKSALEAINEVEASVDISGVVKETKVTVPIRATGVSADPQEVEVTLTPVKISG